VPLFIYTGTLIVKNRIKDYMHAFAHTSARHAVKHIDEKVKQMQESIDQLEEKLVEKKED